MSTRAKWIVALALAIIVGLALASVLRLRAVQTAKGVDPCLRAAAGGALSTGILISTCGHIHA